MAAYRPKRKEKKAEGAAAPIDPKRWKSGNVSGYGGDVYGSPERAFMARRAEALELERRALENQSIRDQIGGGSPGRQPTRLSGVLGADAGQAAMVDQLSRITPADRNPEYNQLSRVLGGGNNPLPMSLAGALQGATPAPAVTNRKIEQGPGYYLQSGQVAGGPAALRDVFNQERAVMDPGAAVVATEGGRAIRLDPNYQYGIQQKIDDPSLRALVPSIAETNEKAKRAALIKQAMEYGAAGIPLPDGSDLERLTDKDIHAMAVTRGKTEPKTAYLTTYMNMPGVLSKLTIHDDAGNTRSLTPAELHNQIVSSIGPAPGSEEPAGADIDAKIQAIAGSGTPAEKTGEKAPGWFARTINTLSGADQAAAAVKPAASTIKDAAIPAQPTTAAANVARLRDVMAAKQAAPARAAAPIQETTPGPAAGGVALRDVVARQPAGARPSDTQLTDFYNQELESYDQQAAEYMNQIRAKSAAAYRKTAKALQNAAPRTRPYYLRDLMGAPVG